MSRGDDLYLGTKIPTVISYITFPKSAEFRIRKRRLLVFEYVLLMFEFLMLFFLSYLMSKGRRIMLRMGPKMKDSVLNWQY